MEQNRYGKGKTNHSERGMRKYGTKKRSKGTMSRTWGKTKHSKGKTKHSKGKGVSKQLGVLLPVNKYSYNYEGEEERKRRHSKRIWRQ